MHGNDILSDDRAMMSKIIFIFQQLTILCSLYVELKRSGKEEIEEKKCTLSMVLSMH